MDFFIFLKDTTKTIFFSSICIWFHSESNQFDSNQFGSIQLDSIQSFDSNQFDSIVFDSIPKARAKTKKIVFVVSFKKTKKSITNVINT